MTSSAAQTITSLFNTWLLTAEANNMPVHLESHEESEARCEKIVERSTNNHNLALGFHFTAKLHHFSSIKLTVSRRVTGIIVQRRRLCMEMPVDPSPLSGSTITVLTEESLLSSPIYQANNNNSTTPNSKSSSSTLYCRICHEDSGTEELIDPCECSGTLALIHTSCLEKWLSTSNTDRCEICKHHFYVKKKKKSIFKSIWQWWKSRNSHGARGIAGDAICLVVLTPLCLAATYLCGIGASAYTRLGFWEGTGLAILCCLLVATYCLWFFVTVRFHYKSWRDWRRRNQEIKLMVKHRSDEAKVEKRASWIIEHNGNNNRSNSSEISPRMNRFASWFGISSINSNDPVFAIHQSTFV